MFARLMALLALLMPVAALAQVAPRTTSVEILANGEVDLPATSFVLRIDWTSKGEDEDAARKAQAEQLVNVRKTLAGLGVSDTAITITEGTEVTTGADYSAYDVATNTTVVEDVTVEDAGDEMNMVMDYSPTPISQVSDFAIVRLGSLAQVLEVQKALAPLGAKVSSITPMLDDPDGARRQAKAKALAAARGDADAYAAVLGMRVVRVVRISETGNGLFLPGFQDKFQRMLTGGPRAFEAMFGADAKPGFVHVEASIVVEFELAPAK
jgi:uncharacterized protein YggE